jgi:hypothetical protein
MNTYIALQAVIVNGLHTLTHLIEKGESFASENSKEESVLLQAQIVPDMFNFIKQAQTASDEARRNLFLLAGKEHVKMEDNETTFAELKARVQKTLDLVLTLTEEDFVGADERRISLFWMQGQYVLGKDFVSEFAYANFFFHLVTAYDILRMQGVPLGKMDFISKLSMKENS